MHTHIIKMNDILNLYRDIEKIKHIQRKGWLKRGVKGVVDTIGSHSYGTTVLGWILAKRENLDENKVIKLLLIHDLIMAHITDYTPKDNQYQSKKEIENKAFNKLIQNVPSDIKEEFIQLFEEYQKEKSEEAKIARESDKLETLFQALIYSEKLGKNEISEFIKTYNNKFKSNTGKAILKELEEHAAIL